MDNEEISFTYCSVLFNYISYFSKNEFIVAAFVNRYIKKDIKKKDPYINEFFILC